MHYVKSSILVFCLIHLMLGSHLHAQCSFTRSNHKLNFVLPNGDTINKKDDLGFQGLHVFSCEATHDTSMYKSWSKGNYLNGLPTGIWKNNCEDGSYALGAYYLSQPAPENVTGMEDKIGTWRYYSETGRLERSEFHKIKDTRHTYKQTIFLQPDSGANVRIYYHVWGNPRVFDKKRVLIHHDRAKTYKYDNHGLLLLVETDRSFGLLQERRLVRKKKTYYPNGIVETKYKRLRHLGSGRRSKSMIHRYSTTGKLVSKELHYSSKITLNRLR